jgi:hypothetical protein
LSESAILSAPLAFFWARMLSRLFIIGARLCHYPFSNTFAEGVRLNCAAPIEFGVQLELELIVLKFNLHGLRLSIDDFTRPSLDFAYIIGLQ